MSLKGDLEKAMRRIEDKEKEINHLKEENRLLREDVRNYETALSAMKWLWDKACDLSPFQL